MKTFAIFKRKRKQKASVVFPVFHRLDIFIERYKRKAADYLNAKAACLSRRQLMMGFWMFCIGFGGYSFYLIVQAFYQPAKAVQLKAIHIPEHSIIPETKEHTNKLLTQREANSIIQFQQYLDSLQQSKTGQQIYDSILHHRPGLLDSLRVIQQLFSEQLQSSENGKKK